MTNYKQVAETLRMYRVAQRVHFDAAIRLCELAAKLPPGEAERVLEAAGRPYHSLIAVVDACNAKVWNGFDAMEPCERRRPCPEHDK
jgi:hypothetical protein